MPAILSAVLFEDAVGGVDGGSGGVNVQINEKWIGESGYNMGVPDLKASAGAQHAGRLDNGLGLNRMRHVHEREKRRNMLKGTVRKSQLRGVHEELFGAFRRFVQFLLTVINDHGLLAVYLNTLR